MALKGERGAADIARKAGVTELVVTDAGCVTDIDTLDDLERAAAL